MLDRGRGGQTVTVASEDDSLAPYYAKYIVPSGSTSAEDKINEAINALPSSGGKVLLQEGTYIIDGDIVYSKDNVSIEGQGIDNTIIFFKASSDPRIYANAKSKVSLKNLTVDGNKANNAGGLLSGVLFDTISGFDINNIAVKNVQTEISGINRGGIALVSCNDGDVKGLALNDNWGDGLYCCDCNNVTIDYIRSNGNQVHGINIDDSVDMNIGSNICIDNGIYGIRLNNVTDSNIVGNTCNNANSPGGAGLILIGNSHRNTVTGNAANKNHSGQGIIIAGNENTVTGNACCDNTSYGIWVVGNKNTVQANKCSGNSYGIVVDAGATANHVTNNDLLDNVSGAWVDSGTSTDTTAGNRP